MKRILLLLFAVLATAVLSVQAATKYEINLGGVEITDENYSSITGKDIRFYDQNNNLKTGPVYSGSYEAYAKYNPNTKTLTLKNVYISRTGSGDYAIHNRDCEGLTVRFEGNCIMKSEKARAIRFNKGGNLLAASGATVNVIGQDDGAIYFRDFAVLYIKGPGTFYIKSTSKKGAIQTHYSEGATMTDLATLDQLKFCDGVTATVESPQSPLYDIWKVYFQGNSKVTLKATGSSSYPVVRNVGFMYFENNNAVLAPYGAYFSTDSRSILSSSGSKVYNQDVVVHNNYVAIINSSNFPDANFRQWMLNAYPKGYITSSDVSSRTAMYCNGNSISSLTGISYFNKLAELYCYNNNLTSLPSLPSTLRTLECYNNQLTSLPTLPSGLNYLKAGSNRFTSLTVSGASNMMLMSFDNNTSLTSLKCSGNGVKNLSISGCSALTTLNCSNNNMSSLPSLPSSLTSLECANNQLSSLPSLPSSLTYLDCDNNNITELPTMPSNIKSVIARNNKLTQVRILDRSKLEKLWVNNNTTLSLVTVSNSTAFTSMGISGCTALKTLTMQSIPNYNFSNLTVLGSVEYFDCGFNKLTSLPTLPGNLKTLCCYHNQLTSLPTLPNSIERVECNDNKFTSLSLTSKPNLKTLRVEDNPSLTTLICNNNALTSLNMSNCNALQKIECHYNQLTSLNVSAMSNLNHLNCSYNKITSLNVSTNSKLNYLVCNGNQLTTLNVQGCAALATLYCGANKLTALSFQGCNALSTVNMVKNQIKDTEMTSMVNSLRTIPAGSRGRLEILDPTSSSEGNVFSDANVRSARAKNWIPYKWQNGSFVEMTISAVRGDINSDGVVDVDDLNIVINIMVKKASQAQWPAADLDGSGTVDVDDLNIVINIMVHKD